MFDKPAEIPARILGQNGPWALILDYFQGGKYKSCLPGVGLNPADGAKI